MTTTVMPMAIKSSNLDNWISGANLQIEGCAPTSASSQKGLKRQEHQVVPLPFSILVSREVTIAWLPQDPVLFRNMCNIN